MDDNRLEMGVVFAGAAVLPSCGTAMIWAGVAGTIPLGTTLFFTALSLIGTIIAVVEIRKGLAQGAERRRQAEARRIAAAQAAAAQAMAEREMRPTWGERIRISNARMGIGDNVRRVDFTRPAARPQRRAA